MPDLPASFNNFPFAATQAEQMMWLFGPLAGLLMILAIVDLALKGWAMWRAARMSKQIWFIALLLVNSLGILPVIFLLLTNKEYAAFAPKKKAGTKKRA